MTWAQHSPYIRNQHGNALEWHGVGFLLVGAPNSGKSELALALMAQGAELVADDQVLLDTSDPDNVIATCPPAIQGMLHTRAQGFLTVPCIPSTIIRHIFRSHLPAAHLSRPPEINVPIHTIDLRGDDALQFILNAITRR